MAGKTILQWTSKVQYKKKTPYVALQRNLDHLKYVDEVQCKLTIENGKIKIVIELEK